MNAHDLIHEARERRGMTQQSAANQAGMTVQHWGQIERGKERGKDETLAKMAQVVGVAPEQLENAGRDLAADRLRELAEPAMSAGLHGAGPEGLDNVMTLTAILRKLTPDEIAWLFAHLDLLSTLSASDSQRQSASA